MSFYAPHTHTRTNTLLSHTNANRYGSSGVTLADAVNSSCACSKRVNGGTKEREGKEKRSRGSWSCMQLINIQRHRHIALRCVFVFEFDQTRWRQWGHKQIHEHSHTLAHTVAHSHTGLHMHERKSMLFYVRVSESVECKRVGVALQLSLQLTTTTTTRHKAAFDLHNLDLMLFVSLCVCVCVCSNCSRCFSRLFLPLLFLLLLL